MANRDGYRVGQCVLAAGYCFWLPGIIAVLGCGGTPSAVESSDAQEVAEPEQRGPAPEDGVEDGLVDARQPSREATESEPGAPSRERRSGVAALDRIQPRAGADATVAWGGVLAGQPDPACGQAPLDWDALHNLLRTDVTTVDPDAKPYTRYVVFSGEEDAPTCVPVPEQGRHALTKLLNMLSTQAVTAVPTTVGGEPTVYRFDLRAFGWDRQVQLGESSYEDGWQAMLSLNPYALSFEGQAAERVAAEVQTEVPWVSASSLARTVMLGDLYYALLGIDTSLNEETLLLEQLGVDALDSLDRLDVVRAVDVPPPGQERVTERLPNLSQTGHLWRSWRYPSTVGSFSIFGDPFHEPEGTQSVAYSLNNGLYAFLIFDEDGRVVPKGAPQYSTLHGETVELAILDLAEEYADELPAVEDLLRGVAERNFLTYDPDMLEAVLEVYLLPEQFAEVQRQDADAQRSVLSQLGIPAGLAAPVVRLVERFERRMSPPRVAAELGVSVEVFRQLALVLPPEVAQVMDRPLARSVFSEHFLQAACALQAQSQNLPKGCP